MGGSRLQERVGRALSVWTDAVVGRAGLVLVAMAAATALLGLYAATHLGVNADNKELLDEGLPFQEASREFEARFPGLADSLLVVIEGETPERTREATERLRAALERRGERFRDVWRPNGRAFFERVGLLFLSVPELEDFGDSLARLQPVIAELSAEPTLPNLVRLLRRGLDEEGSLRVDEERLARVLDGFSRASGVVYAEHPVAVSWEDLLLRGTAFDPTTRRVLVAEPVLEFDRVLAAEPAMRAIHEAAEAEGLVPERGVRVRVTGYPALNAEEMRGLAVDVGFAGILSFLLVLVVLRVAFRSLRLVAAAAATLLAGLVWTAAFAAATVGALNVISVAFAVLFVGLGIDFAIHLGMHYGERRREGEAHGPAMRAAVRGVGGALLLCTVTTAIGFLAFVPTDYRGVAELGVIAAGGMGVILVQTLTLFPALLSKGLALRGAATAPSPAHWLRRTTPRNALAHPGRVLAGALALGAGALALLPQARFDSNVILLRDPDAESVRAFQELLESGTASPWHADALAPSLEAAGELARRLEALPEVERALTLRSFVPQEQEEKRAILADLAFLMEPPAARDGAEAPAPPPAEQVEALRALEEALARPAVREGTGPLAESARRLGRRLGALLDRLESDAERAETLERLEALLLGGLESQLERLRRALDPPRVELEDLPGRIRDRMLAEDGTARVQIFPSRDLGEAGALRDFVEAVQGVAPRAAGLPVSVEAFGQATAESMREALVLAVAVIALLLVALWRSALDALVALVPLALAGLLTVATVAVLGVSFNFANVIVLPLLLGIGVDSGIHLVARARAAGPDEATLPATTTARAVLFSALTTLASFGSLALSDHRGIASLGILLLVGMAWTLAANLILLPALVALRTRRVDAARRPS